MYKNKTQHIFVVKTFGYLKPNPEICIRAVRFFLNLKIHYKIMTLLIKYYQYFEEKIIHI